MTVYVRAELAAALPQGLPLMYAYNTGGTWRATGPGVTPAGRAPRDADMIWLRTGKRSSDEICRLNTAGLLVRLAQSLGMRLQAGEVPRWGLWGHCSTWWTLSVSGDTTILFRADPGPEDSDPSIAVPPLMLDWSDDYAARNGLSSRQVGRNAVGDEMEALARVIEWAGMLHAVAKAVGIKVPAGVWPTWERLAAPEVWWCLSCSGGLCQFTTADVDDDDFGSLRKPWPRQVIGVSDDPASSLEAVWKEVCCG